MSIKIYDFADSGQFIICHSGDVSGFAERFGWDESTAIECLNLDETVRYTAYDGYDFISLIHMGGAGVFVQREINLFVSKAYLVLVLPENEGERLRKLAGILCAASESLSLHQSGQNPLARLYYLVLSGLAADFSDTLEALEDEMEELAERVAQSPEQEQLDEIGDLRKRSYTAKKVLRAISYIGGEILLDENKLLHKQQIHYFRDVDTRLKKLYDFADSLNEFCAEILRVYDSKNAMKMNETVNKLTVITLFFGPLTVITGIYGMNFKFMPELNWEWGYPAAVCVMVLVCTAIYVVLKKKKWI
ncbi:cation transporter [Clostridia bacterium]|nr:cation transporter [Clostridia bacterium]